MADYKWADPLETVRGEVAHRLDEISALFKPGVHISVFVRSPGFPDRDFILTNDTLAEVVAMIERRDPTLLAKRNADG